MVEKEIQRKILSYLKTYHDVFVFKTQAGYNTIAGLPDIICCVRGVFVALEVKTDKGRLSEAQKIIQNRIRETGGISEVVRSIEDVENILGSIL